MSHLPIGTTDLPTPLAQVVTRLNVGGLTDSSDCFLKTSYVAETAIKLLGLALAGGLAEKAPEHAYRMRYLFVRADGLGVWDQLIRQASSLPLAGFLPPSMSDLVEWSSKKRSRSDDAWFHDATDQLVLVFGLLGLECPIPDRRPSVRDVLSGVVQLRNKTRAHGAAGDEFFAQANEPFVGVVKALVTSCPLFEWRWLHLSHRANGSLRGVWLTGQEPHHVKDADLERLRIAEAGAYFWPVVTESPVGCGQLLVTDRECARFALPNGGWSDSGHASFMDYARGLEDKLDVGSFSRAPARLPASETEGLASVAVHSNVFGNLPPEGRAYIARPGLEGDLDTRLRDKNHPIVTLHGRGGIGKTSLALRAAYQLAAELEPLFDQIVWFSARDVDLGLHGPRAVRPAVIDLEQVARTFGRLFAVDETVEGFAQALRQGDGSSGRGTLFIFDNFETMSDPRGVHQFLDTHAHLPNKVLITSRERAFKADFPIEVRGMEATEANALITAVARELQAEPLITASIRDGIYSFAEGHPYVMRVLVGETVKEGRYVPPKTLLPRRDDILEAVFERSFNKLSAAGRWVFLITTNWRSSVSEAALLVVLAQRGIDAESGIDECLRLSMITRTEYLDGYPAYSSPHVARLYGRKKLVGDPDRMVVQEDLELIRRFGVLPTHEPIQIPQDEALNAFADWCMSRTGEAAAEEIQRLDRVLESLSAIWPPAWSSLAEFRARTSASRADVEHAHRRAVEEAPADLNVWLRRAAYALGVGDDATFVAARIRAVELAPDDVALVREVAGEVVSYVSRHASDIPLSRRGVYLASVRSHMLRHAERLDATGLSRLAWLYFNEGSTAEAWRYASRGLEIEPDNQHCYKIIQRLRDSGFVPH